MAPVGKAQTKQDKADPLFGGMEANTNLPDAGVKAKDPVASPSPDQSLWGSPLASALSQALSGYNVQNLNKDKYLQYLIQQKTHPKDVGNLVSALAQSQGWTPSYIESPQASGGGADPLAAQMFWGNVVSPFLSQLGSQMAGTAGIEQQQMSQILKDPNLPQSYKAVLGASIPQEVAGTKNYAASLEAQTAAGPGWNDLLTAIAGAKQQAELSRQEQIRAIANGLTGTTGQGVFAAPTVTKK